ncbi:MAG: NAD(P)-dependent oxidoreductase [Victivallales bacterium]
MIISSGMKVFVTGASGRIGKTVVRKLASSGLQVKAFDRAVPEQKLPGVEYANGDINDFNFLLRHMKGADAVVHLAALPGPEMGTSQEIIRINVLGTFNVFRTAVENGVKKIVQASSINALGAAYNIRKFKVQYFPIDEGHPSSLTDPYALSKKMGEEVAEYFWNKDSLSSFSLRFPSVIDTSNLKFWFKDKELAMKAINELEEMGVEERLHLMDEVFRNMESINQEVKKRRILGKDAPPIQMKLVMENVILWSGKEFWTYLDFNDCAQSVLKSLQADVEGAHPLFICAANNGMGYETKRLISIFFPDVRTFKKEIKGAETAVSIDKAVKLTGFAPEYTIGPEGK